LSSYSDKIADFHKRIADIGARLTALTDRRKSYAYAAATGDTRALKQITDTDYEEASLVKEQQTLNSAVETALALERQHELEAKASEEHTRQVEAYSAARGVITINEELDLALLHLRELFERRAVVLRSLANTATVDPSLLMRLSNKAGPTSACHAAGLGRHIHLEMVPVVAQRTLSDANSILLGIGEQPKGNGKANGNGRVRVTRATS
jgi:hypothetical protein